MSYPVVIVPQRVEINDADEDGGFFIVAWTGDIQAARMLGARLGGKITIAFPSEDPRHAAVTVAFPVDKDG